MIVAHQKEFPLQFLNRYVALFREDTGYRIEITQGRSGFSYESRE
jgi:hypothetical protein